MPTLAERRDQQKTAVAHMILLLHNLRTLLESKLA